MQGVAERNKSISHIQVINCNDSHQGQHTQVGLDLGVLQVRSQTERAPGNEMQGKIHPGQQHKNNGHQFYRGTAKIADALIMG